MKGFNVRLLHSLVELLEVDGVRLYLWCVYCLSYIIIACENTSRHSNCVCVSNMARNRYSLFLLNYFAT